MRFLIDTHVLLWWMTAPGNLSQTAANLLKQLDSSILVSVVVPLEMAIKTTSGKLDVGTLLPDFEERNLGEGFQMQTIETAHAIRSGLLPFHHRDPFDRLLAAQSLEMNIPLISRDQIFDAYGIHRIW